MEFSFYITYLTVFLCARADVFYVFVCVYVLVCVCDEEFLYMLHLYVHFRADVYVCWCGGVRPSGRTSAVQLLVTNVFVYVVTDSWTRTRSPVLMSRPSGASPSSRYCEYTASLSLSLFTIESLSLQWKPEV